MTICRVQHDKNNPYTLINRGICEDSRLSYKAKGLWLYAFSRPDDWKFNLKDLVNRGVDGPDSVSSGLKELEEAGYLYRYQIRKPNGQLGSWEWIFYETPREIKKFSPQPDFPDTVDPSSVDPALLSSKDILISKKQQTEPRKTQDVKPVKEGPSGVVVFSCLKELEGVCETLKMKICKDYTEEQVKKAVACLERGRPRSPEKFLLGALNGNWEPAKTSDDCEEEDLKALKELKRQDGRRIGPYQVRVNRTSIEFVNGSFSKIIEAGSGTLRDLVIAFCDRVKSSSSLECST